MVLKGFTVPDLAGSSDVRNVAVLSPDPSDMPDWEALTHIHVCFQLQRENNTYVGVQ